MLHLITGRAGTGKTARVMEELRLRVAGGRDGGILLVPEQYSHEAERELCLVCGDALSLYAEVLSFTRLASRVEEELTTASPLLDKCGRLLCMALAAKNAAPALTVYRDAERRPELQRSLLEALDELKAAGATPGLLEGVAPAGSLGEKLRDLALVMEAYDAVTARSALDPADRLSRLAENVGRSRVCRGHIYVDGFTDFTRQELQVLRALLAGGADMTVCLTLDLDDPCEAFELSEHTLNALRRMAEELRVPVRETVARPRGDSRRAELRFFERNIFAPGTPRYEGECGAITLFAAETPAGECEMAAARAVELARDGGCRWRDIAVAVRGFDDYRPHLEAAFASYGVPLFVSRRDDITAKPLPALIGAAFEILSGGWEYEDVFAYLRTGLAGLSPEECDELENYAIVWSVRGSMWTGGDWRLSPAGYGGEARPETMDRLNGLRRRFAEPLSALYAAGRGAETATAQARALLDFFAAIRLPENLAARAETLTSQGREAEAAEQAQLWELVAGALTQLSAILGDAPMEQEEFARLLALMLSACDVGVIPVALDRVSAGDLDRMRRRHIKHLLLLGASDERLPAGEGGGGLFSSDEREALAALDLPLGGAEEDICREFGLIYNCLTLPSESLTVSYSRSGAEGAPARLSFVMARAAALFSLEVRPAPGPEKRLNAPGPALELAASSRSPEGDAAREWLRQRRPGRLEALSRAARLSRGRLSSGSVRALYGETPRLSPSKVDALASCRFAYFLRYGLRAKPREPAGFDPPQLGSFMHRVLEGVASEAAKSGGFKALSPERIRDMTDRQVELYIKDELDDFRERSPRFIYLFRRLTLAVREVVLDMARELQKSDFEPLDFELRFSEEREGFAVNGVADRLDGWLSGDRLYLRVVDYKTGNKTFSLSDVWYGMGMQMLIYLFSLQKSGAERFGREVVPAGALYVPAKYELLKSDGPVSDEELTAARDKSRKRSGLLLCAPELLEAMEHGDAPEFLPVKFGDGVPTGDALATAEQLGLLARRVEDTLAKMAGELRRGSIDADPYFRSRQKNACAFCEYAEACHFDESGDRRRYAPNLKPAEVWNRLKEAGEHE